MPLSKDWYKVNFTLLPSKLCYLFFTAKSAYQAFMILFLMDIGLTAQEASLVNGLHYLGFLFGGPILAFIADKFRCHYRIVKVSITLAIIAMIMGPILSVSISSAPTNTCKIKTNFNSTNSSSTNNSTHKNEKANLLVTVLLLFTCSSVFGDSILGFVDAATVNKQTKTGKNVQYCFQRLFEPIGWQCGVFLSGILVNYFPKSNVTCYTGVFVSVEINQFLLAVCLYILYRNVKIRIDKSNVTKKSSWKMVKKIFKQPKHILFLLTVTLLGTYQGIYVNLTFLFLKALSASNSYMTWYAAVASLSVIVFHLLTPLLHRITTNAWLLLFSVSMAYFFRYFTFWITSDLNLLLVSAFLQGFHAFFVTTVVSYVQKEFPIEIHSTVFNICNALVMSFGYVVSNLLGVNLYKLLGGKVFFFYIFISAFIWSFILLIAFFLEIMKTIFKGRQPLKKEELKYLNANDFKE